MNPDNTQKFSASDSEKLSLILTGVQSLTVRFDNVDSRLNNIDSRLGSLDSRLEIIDSRVIRVEQTVNDMRPVLQKAVTDIAQLQQGHQELREGQVRLHQTVLQIEDGQRMLREGQERIGMQVYALSRDVSDRFMVLSGATNAEVKDLQKRVTSLEANSNPPKPQT